MNTEQITIAGTIYTAPSPYVAGHTVTEGEASALNQVLHENGRNNLARKAKDGTLTQADVDAYFATYQFGVRTGGGGARRDPIESKAMDIARDKVRDALKRGGKNLKDFTAAQITQAATQALAGHPEWTELARRQVEEERALNESIDIAGLDFSVPAKAEANGSGEQPQG